MSLNITIQPLYFFMTGGASVVNCILLNSFQTSVAFHIEKKSFVLL